MSKVRIKELKNRLVDDPMLRYKEHLDMVAAMIFAGTRQGQYATAMSVEMCVQRALEIINTVDQVVEHELEVTGHRLGV